MKDYNFCAFVVGPSGWGKTTIARALIRRHADAHPNGIVFAHDPERQFGKDGCQWYANADAWRHAARAAMERREPIPRLASIDGDSVAMDNLVWEVSEKVNRADDVRVPILDVKDEASLHTGSGPTWLGAEDNALFSTRRHRGCGLVLALQNAKQLSVRVLERATDLYVFVQPRKALRHLDEAMMLEPGTLELAGARELGEHRYLHVRPVVGVVADPL